MELFVIPSAIYARMKIADTLDDGVITFGVDERSSYSRK